MSNRPNFFCDKDTLAFLIDLEYPEDHPTIDISVDFIDAPYWFIFSADDENWMLRAIQRGELFGHDENISIDIGSLTVDKATGDGTGNTSDQLLGEGFGAFFRACKNLSCYAQENSWEALFGDLNPEESGVMLDNDGKTLTYKIVSGKDRPELMCATLFGDVIKMRPYMDDFLERSAADFMSHEEKIEAAEDGNEIAMEQLAFAYLEGDDEVGADPEKAVYWYTKLAELDNSDAQFNLGLHYAKGFGIERNFEMAVYWLEKAVENGDVDAPDLIEKLNKAVAAEKIISTGDAQAQANLAEVYMFIGNSISQADPDKDYAIALEYAQKSAAQNNGDGLWALALAYEHGRGIEQDIEKAIECYRKGAEIGHAPSQHSLACYYFRGDVLEQDDKKAFELCMKSAEQGYGLAMADVGRCYQFGNGVMGNMKTATEWYEKALEVIDDPELERKTVLLKMIGEDNDHWDEDYPGADFPLNGDEDVREDDEKHEIECSSLSEKEQIVLNCVKKFDDGRGLPAKAYYDYSSWDGLLGSMKEEEFFGILESLSSQGYLLKNVSLAGEDLYIVKQDSSSEEENDSGDWSTFADDLAKALAGSGQAIADDEMEPQSSVITATDYDLYNWTFTEGKRESGDGWSVAIPDGFVVIESQEGRIFEAVPLGMEEEESDFIPIRILPGEGQNVDFLDQDFWMYHPYARKGIAEMVAVQRAETVAKMVGAAADVLSVSTDDVTAYILLQNTSVDSYSYHCQILTNKKDQALRIQTDSITKKQKESLTKSVLEWLETFRFDEENELIPKETLFESEKVFGDLKHGLTKSFRDAVDKAQQEYSVTFNGLIGTQQYRNEYGIDNPDLLNNLKDILSRSMEVKEFYLVKAYDLIEKMKDLQLEPGFMKKIYTKLKDLEPCVEDINWGNEKVSIERTAKIEEITAICKKELSEITIVAEEAERKKRIEERRQKEAEQKRIEDEKHKAKFGDIKDEEILRLLLQAYRYLKNHEHEKATDAFKGIIRKLPNERIGYFGLAVALADDGKLFDDIFRPVLTARDKIVSPEYEQFTNTLREHPWGEHGNTLLMGACYSTRLNVVEALLEMGADIHKCNTFNCTALWFVCFKPLPKGKDLEGIQIAKILLDRGAKVDVENKGGVSLYNCTTNPTIAQMIQRKYPGIKLGAASDNPTRATEKSGGCYVATAVYGSYDCPEVWTLRRFRDDTLAETWYGRAFIKTYYAVSPTLVKWFGNTVWFKKMWKGKLDRMVAKLQSKGVESTPYEDKTW